MLSQSVCGDREDDDGTRLGPFLKGLGHPSAHGTMWQMRLWDFVTIQRSFLQAGSIPSCPFLCSECPMSAADGCGAN